MPSHLRKLSLHHSALSPTEYEAYTTSLARLTEKGWFHEDPDWENARLGLSDVRGSLRERFGDLVSFGDIDTVLSYFSGVPQPLSVQTMSGGEYFAILRLIHHIKAGKTPSQDLAFIQVHDLNKKPLTSKYEVERSRKIAKNRALLEDLLINDSPTKNYKSRTNRPKVFLKSRRNKRSTAGVAMDQENSKRTMSDEMQPEVDCSWDLPLA